MQSDAYHQGYKDGYNESRQPMDAFQLSQKIDDYRVGYVMGICATIEAPREYWAPLAGEQAADLQVRLDLFKPYIEGDVWHLFVEGYRSKDAERGDDENW